MSLPPSEAGTLQPRSTELLPATASTDAGASGRVAADRLGVTAADAGESAPVPTPLIAATLNVYAVPLVRPPTTLLVAPVVVVTGVCGVAPTYGVMWYPVIRELPSELGAVQLSATDLSRGVPWTFVGAPAATGGGGVAQATVTSSK